jgi:hypothetical protein
MQKVNVMKIRSLNLFVILNAFKVNAERCKKKANAFSRSHSGYFHVQRGGDHCRPTMSYYNTYRVTQNICGSEYPSIAKNIPRFRKFVAQLSPPQNIHS